MAQTDEEIDYTSLSKHGIKLFINNHPREARELFEQYPDSVQMAAGLSMVTFMDALMSLEEEKMAETKVILQDTQKKCQNDTGWFRSLKRSVNRQADVIEMTLEKNIIMADAEVCQAIIIFLQQDFTGYLKGGWVLRKAWQIYKTTYTQIRELYIRNIGPFDFPEETDFEWNDSLPGTSSQNPLSSNSRHSSRGLMSSTQLSPGAGSSTTANPKRPASQPIKKNGDLNQPVEPEKVLRLMGAVSFGFGLLQLGISLLPSSLIKLSSFFGFSGTRSAGIKHLMYARQGTDMRAPLATLSLLWYHTIVRPFYALDDNNIRAGTNAANLLMVESQNEYSESVLFLYFKGRIQRLDGDISKALASFQKAVENSQQREIKLLTLHEVGWCYLIQLEYENGRSTFGQLKVGSRWSRHFYVYCELITAGSAGSMTDNTLIGQFTDLLGKSKQKNSQLDIFLTRRMKTFPPLNAIHETPQSFWRLLIYELMFLWNALPSCNKKNNKKIIADCDTETMEPMPGVAMLIQGECYSIQGLRDEAINSFRKCVHIRKNYVGKDDVHISAFAEYSLGMLLVLSEATKNEGITLIHHSYTYKDYDFDNKLHVRIESALKRLSKSSP